jgi:uncharacterized membrane protein
MISDHTVVEPGAERASGSLQNVGNIERAISGGIGAALLLGGLRRRSLGGLLLAALGGALAWRGISGRCRLYSALGLDTRGHEGPARPEDFYQRGVLVHAAVTINAPPEQLYQFWRSLENLPRFMRNLEEVRVIDDKRSHWVVKGPAGTRVEWDAEIINDEPPHTIAWRTLEHADVEHTGSVRFVPAPGNRGTHVKVRMEYLPPGGKVGNVFLKVIGEDPHAQVKEDLRRLKQILETGEVPTRCRAADVVDRAGAADPVEEASADSFPASDPPGWGSTQV